jgi:hypothetical protein
MKRRSSGFVIGIIVSIVLGFGIVAGVWLSLRSATALGYEPGVWRATKTGPNTATLNISTFPDSNICHAGEGKPQIDWVTYCPSTSFEVPPNSLVTVVINQYDSPSGLVNDYFQPVRGTVGNVMMVNNRPMTQLNVDDVAHTFTLQSTLDSAHPLFVSVPLLGFQTTLRMCKSKDRLTRSPMSSLSRSVRVRPKPTSGIAMSLVEATAESPMVLAGRCRPRGTWQAR